MTTEENLGGWLGDSSALFARHAKEFAQLAIEAEFPVVEFNDDFDDPGVIDYDNTRAPGFNWYVHRIGQGYAAKTHADNITVADSILKLGDGTTNEWCGLYTCARTDADPWHVGHSHGGNDTKARFYECRLRFDPAKGASSVGFPGWWAMSMGHFAGDHFIDLPGGEPGERNFIEVDFFEALPVGDYTLRKTYPGTIINWYGTWAGIWSGRIPNDLNRGTPLGLGFIDWENWHRYGFLHQPRIGETPGYGEFYFDGKPRMRVYWLGPVTNGSPLMNDRYPAGNGNWTPDTPEAAAETYSCIDIQPITLCLQAHRDWPMEVDWVRVRSK